MLHILREKGYKATPARLAILNILTQSHAPVTALTICRELKKDKRNKNINEATVYRTLSLFLEGGMITKVDLRKESAYFELAGTHHHHITCRTCDRVEDFHDSAIEKAIQNIVRDSSKFITVNDHSLELFGLCRECAK